MALGESFFSNINPSLSAGGVYLVLGVAFFQVWQKLMDLENGFERDQMERVKGLVSNFRDRYITPVVGEHIFGAMTHVYITTVAKLEDIIVVEVLEDGNLVRKFENPSVLEGRGLANLVEAPTLDQAGARLSTADGSPLLPRLDELYNRKQEYINMYLGSRLHCRKASYAALALSILMVGGLSRFIWSWSIFLDALWTIASVLSFIYGCYGFIMFEVGRRKIVEFWTNYSLYSTLR